MAKSSSTLEMECIYSVILSLNYVYTHNTVKRSYYNALRTEKMVLARTTADWGQYRMALKLRRFWDAFGEGVFGPPGAECGF